MFLCLFFFFVKTKLPYLINQSEWPAYYELDILVDLYTPIHRTGEIIANQKDGHPFCVCLRFKSWYVKSLLQSSSNVAAPVVRRRSGRVTRSTWWWRRSAATWSPSCSSSSTGESSEAEWQDRPMIESWSNEKINLSDFVQYKSLKRRILLLWLVRKKLNQLRCWLFCTVSLCTVFNGFLQHFSSLAWITTPVQQLFLVALL